MSRMNLRCAIMNLCHRAFVAVLLLSSAISRAADPAPTASLRQWAVEQMPGGSVTMRDGALVIEDAGGCTVWWREKLMAPVEISYEVTVVPPATVMAPY